MTNPLPSWYPDPTGRHELRYWDGSQWTAQVVSAGVGATDFMTSGSTDQGASQSKAVPRRRRFGLRKLGWLGLVLCLCAGVAALPGFGLDLNSSDHGIQLNGSTQRISLPPHKTYGIYVIDADNSGYSEDCSAVDADGRSVHFRDPSWTISTSDAENLDIVFNTGSGQLTFTCSVPGERVVVKPVSNTPRMFLNLTLVLALGCVGGTMIIVWFVYWLGERGRRRAPG